VQQEEVEHHFEGVFGPSSSPSHIFDPKVVGRYLSELNDTRRPDAQAMATLQDESLVVLSSVEPRCDVRAGDSWHTVFGCAAYKKSVCRQHPKLSADVMARMDGLCKKLNCCVDTFDKEDKAMVDRGEVLLWCHRVPADCDGASSSSTSVPSMSEHIDKPDTIVVIAGVRRSPKMQYIMRCHVAGEAESEFYFKKPECEYNSRG
jgi:hypothetical protein